MRSLPKAITFILMYTCVICVQDPTETLDVINEILASPAVCLWGIRSCSLNHVRVVVQMVMDTKAICNYIKAKRGIPIHHMMVYNTNLIFWSGTGFILHLTLHLSLLLCILWASPFSSRRQMKTAGDSQSHTAPLSNTFTDLFQIFFLTNFFFPAYLLGVSLILKLHLLFHPKMPQDSAHSMKHHASPGNSVSSVPKHEEVWRASHRHLEIVHQNLNEKPTYSVQTTCFSTLEKTCLYPKEKQASQTQPTIFSLLDK